MNARPVLFFLITLTPVPLLLLAVTKGGLWIPCVIIYMTLFAIFCDEAFELDFSKAGQDWIARQALPIILSAVHFFLLPVAVYALGKMDLSTLSKLFIFLAFSQFFGMISHSNAHELIHRTNLLHHTLGKWVFISLLYGHHTSAHLLVHHPYVTTSKDPNSARLNEGFYKFAARAMIGEFLAGLQAEQSRLQKRGYKTNGFKNPYWQYGLGACGAIALSYVIAGLLGMISFVGLCLMAQFQMLMTDYIQHYGLHRKRTKSGKYEPISPYHSWNAPHWFSSFMTLNAPRHSDHHAAPAKPYTDLKRLRDTAPQLPYSLPFMVGIALWPPKWRAVMNPRVKAWQNG